MGATCLVYKQTSTIHIALQQALNGRALTLSESQFLFYEMKESDEMIPKCLQVNAYQNRVQGRLVHTHSACFGKAQAHQYQQPHLKSVSLID